MKRMNKMKIRQKGSMLLVAFTVAAAIGLAGCGTAENTAKDQGSTNQTDEAGQDSSKDNDTNAQASGYTFQSNGVTIGVDMDMAPIEEALGEASSVFEQPSCAAQGTAYLYTYSGFEINTYPDGDTNYIAYILLKDDTVATPEGVDLSMTKDDIIAAYGENYTEDENKITYAKDGMTLNFLLDEDGSIISIEYDSGVLNGTEQENN